MTHMLPDPEWTIVRLKQRETQLEVACQLQEVQALVTVARRIREHHCVNEFWTEVGPDIEPCDCELCLEFDAALAPFREVDNG